ncbi:MAG: thiosulfate oxidation carrier protein SoxY [Xanthobacteraceae bacterium]|nr:thiosulfate oxidation carrier protein SoxY [Xanthobacteraceae bacterium]
MANLSRRDVLLITAGSAALAVTGAPPAAANVGEAIKSFTGGSAPEVGRVTLDLAASIEDGNSVPLGVAVESPMRRDDYVSEVLVVAEANPWPRVATFQFSPIAGKAAFSTRIRLTEAQNVTVLAKMNDGRVFMARQHVDVTIGACAS